jgi:hypothetical protein
MSALNHNTDLIHEALILPEVREGKEKDLEKFVLDLAEHKSCATIIRQAPAKYYDATD